MKKSFSVQPQDFGQTFRFWMRRPDYGFRALWEGLPLTVTPDEGQLEWISGRRMEYRVRETVNGATTTLWLLKSQVDPSGFDVADVPEAGWWEFEGREIVMDYLRTFVRNSPSAHACYVMMIASLAFLYRAVRDPMGLLTYMKSGDLHTVIYAAAALALVLPFASLALIRLHPPRTQLAAFVFRAEAWFLLLCTLAWLPSIGSSFEHLRADFLRKADEAALASAPPPVAVPEAPQSPVSADDDTDPRIPASH